LVIGNWLLPARPLGARHAVWRGNWSLVIGYWFIEVISKTKFNVIASRRTCRQAGFLVKQSHFSYCCNEKIASVVCRTTDSLAMTNIFEMAFSHYLPAP